MLGLLGSLARAEEFLAAQGLAASRLVKCVKDLSRDVSVMYL